KAVIVPPEPVAVKEKEDLNEPPLLDIVKERHSVIVELAAPKHLEIDEYMKGVRALHKAGIDAITLADNSLATPRICNSAIATLIQQEIGLRPLVHITCRDRNLIGLQSHLMVRHTLVWNYILRIPGESSNIRHLQGVTSVFGVTSFYLLKLIKQCNQGHSLSGKSLKTPTNFTVT